MPDAYAALSDRQIITLLTVEWDDEGGFIPETSCTRRTAAPSGSIAAAMRELPAPEMLGLSGAQFRAAMDFRDGPDVRYLTMFLSVWKRRGKTTDEALALWREHLATRN